MNSLPGMGVQIPEFALIDIKFDGPSFEGVIDIGKLGNELLGLEYCIKEIFKKIKLSDKKFEKISEDDLLILVEPFQNNCFRKKIRIARKLITNLTGKEIAVLCGLITLIPPTISGIYTIIKVLTPDQIQEVSKDNISPQLLEQISDQIQAELLADPKFRKEVAKIALPLSNTEDIGEIRTQDIEGNEQLVTIDVTNKEKFLAIGGYERITKEEITCYEKREILYGRMNAIDVDATKRQIGFKLNGDGSEIDCTLMPGLNIHDYKILIGGWVNVEGIVSYDGIVPKRIDIEKITSAEAPLGLAKNISLNI